MKKTIERIVKRPASPGMVGDGFRVFNLIPGAGISQRRISPFLLLDFNAAHDFGPSDHVRGVDVHPHKGFETVTVAYQGAVEHHDSKGNHGIIYPGDVQWMTAGNGILHKEYHEKEFSRKGGAFEMVQLWVNLPKKFKSEEAHYQAIADSEMGLITLPNNGGTIKVIAGNFGDAKGPANTYSPVNLVNLYLNKDGEATTTIDAAHNTALLIINGSATINGENAPEHSFVLFGNDGEEISIKANEKTVILLLSGEPIDEPIASYGPFVMNTQDEIYEAIKEYNAGKYGEIVD